jgi:hypothetical protein
MFHKLTVQTNLIKLNENVLLYIYVYTVIIVHIYAECIYVHALLYLSQRKN